jgi:hypothetical protein
MSSYVDGLPDEFIKVAKDLVNDLKTTFPEYKPFVQKWWKDKEQFQHIEDENDRKNAMEKAEQKSLRFLFDFCKKKLPPRFFDILYQNEEIFKEDSEIDTEFLPKIHFKNLWQCDISTKTRETLWKYMQLLLFSIIGTLDNKESFGDTAKLFEAIDENEFKTKLQETLNQMHNLFDISANETFGENINLNDLPNPEKMNEHITGILDGKIGQLAREIAEETATDLNVSFDEASDMKDVFTKLIKNPNKLMGLIKNIGDKLDNKLKSGELKESEMIEEATEFMNKMKHIPGMGNIQSMLSKMGMNMGGGSKVNTSAMESQLNQRLKMAKTKERLRAKAEAKAKEKATTELINQLSSMAEMSNTSTTVPDDELIQMFRKEEKPEKTPRKKSNDKKKKK